VHAEQTWEEFLAAQRQPAAVATPRRRHGRMRICFLFNHDQIHQVAHSLPIALSLADSGFNGEIIVATTTPRLACEVRKLAGAALGTRLEHRQLELSQGSRRLSRLLGGLLPAAKVLVYRDNLEFFRSLDILVVAEKTSLILKKVYGLTGLRIIHTRHGAGDRAIGFDKASAGFDHVLCSGAKIKERLVAEAGVRAESISIVGYPKFDLLQPANSPLPLRDHRPVVLYNPHPSPHLSSWYRHGHAVLDFFLDNDDYQLIFAPHVMLFERKVVISIDKLRLDRPGRIPERFLRASNIHIDLGSRASTDMTYTQVADIYLGDVSSQIYEFLRTPRPCLFLNSQQLSWRGNANFAHWQAGPVIEQPAQIEAGLRESLDQFEGHYRPIQKKLFDHSFDLNETPSSRRAAEVIARYAAA
jgi:hypothetical protein